MEDFVKQEPELHLYDTEYQEDEEVGCGPTTGWRTTIKQEPDEEIVHDDSDEDDERESKLKGHNNPMFNCDICSFVCAKVSVLLRHVEDIHLNGSIEEKPYSVSPSRIERKNTSSFYCEYCPKRYECPLRLKYHERSHTDSTSFPCDECPMTYAHQTSLTRHKISHLGMKLYECKVCSKRLISNANLKDHMIIHQEEKPFNCHICSKPFTKKRTLSKHVNVHHAYPDESNSDKSFKCDECSALFTSAAGLKIHKQNHAREKCFRCAICSKDFSIRYQFIEHMNSHANTSTHCSRRSRLDPSSVFSCDKCPKRFKAESSLRRHKLDHTNGSHEECDICHKSIQRSYMTAHKKYHAGVLTYKCVHCQKAFSKRSKLQLHKSMHLNETVLSVTSEVICLVDEQNP